MSLVMQDHDYVKTLLSLNLILEYLFLLVFFRSL